ncbi:MAG: hypothetical protein M0Q45_09245 [Bacteroidales bacterium]|jgi:hypothetical protein|nr:hypothetical protein [Bacteroidales bacterium]MCK9499677.1 hypothetical protein [Bacteroidales bacterium]MDY0315685.1 hypothetical protein [Bacteroidales bacterium]
MKKLFLLSLIILSFGFLYAQDCNCDEQNIIESNFKFTDLNDFEKTEAIQALLAGDCYYKGIKLWGKVQFVTSFPDFKIQYVESFPDIKVKYVSSFPDSCGKWQVVESFPDFKVQIVNSFPDVKVKIVDSFPGVN